MGIMTATTTVLLSNKPSRTASLTRMLSFSCVDDKVDVKNVDEEVEEVLSEWWGCRELENTEPVVEEEEEEEPAEAPILGLPDDVMTQILAQLPRRSLAVARLVCSDWKRVAEQQEIASIRRKIGVAEGWIYVNLAESSVFRAYDPATSKWTSLPPTPWSDASSQWQGFSTVALGHKLLVIGGTRTQTTPNHYASSTMVSRELLIYDALTNKWSRGASMSTPRSYFAAAAVGDNKVYVAGGQGVSKFLASGEVYDATSNTWTAIADLNLVRSSCRGFSIGSQFWIVAGEYNKRGRERSSAEVYDAKKNSWRVVSNMYLDDKKVMEPAVVINGDSLICIHQRRVMAYKAESNSWTQRGWVHGGEVSCFTRVGFACESVGESLFLVGGSLQNRNRYCTPASSVEVCELDERKQAEWKIRGDMGRDGGAVSASVVSWL